MFVRWNYRLGATQNSFAISSFETAGEGAEDRQLPLGEAECLRAGLLALLDPHRRVDVALERLAGMAGRSSGSRS
jgi:hypothetical protein